MAGTVLELRHVDHNSILKSGLAQLMYHAGYLNVKVIGKDGTLYHNRMTIGLIFPELRDESTIIIPDMTVQEITHEINKVFRVEVDDMDSKESTSDDTEDSVVIINDDEKSSLNEVTDELFDSEDDFVMFEHENDENDAPEVPKTDPTLSFSEWLARGSLNKRKKNRNNTSKSKQNKIESLEDLNDGSLHEEEEFIENICLFNEINLNNNNIGPSSKVKLKNDLVKNGAAFPLNEAPLKLRKNRRIVGRCHKCPNCKMENCGECHACLNMKQFGGTGSLKKACTSRPACLEKNKKNDTFTNRQKTVVKLFEDESIPIVEEVKGGVFIGDLLTDEEEDGS